MSKYQQLIMSAAVEKVRHQVTPLLDKMTDQERDRCAEVMQICMSATIEAMEAMTAQPTRARAPSPRQSSFDQVMNTITFGLWD